MNFLKQILRNIVASPITTAFGVSTIYGQVQAIAQHPATLADPVTGTASVAAILGGVTLLGSVEPWKVFQALQQQPAPPASKEAAAGK